MITQQNDNLIPSKAETKKATDKQELLSYETYQLIRDRYNKETKAIDNYQEQFNTIYRTLKEAKMDNLIKSFDKALHDQKYLMPIKFAATMSFMRYNNNIEFFKALVTVIQLHIMQIDTLMQSKGAKNFGDLIENNKQELDVALDALVKGFYLYKILDDLPPRLQENTKLYPDFQGKIPEKFSEQITSLQSRYKIFLPKEFTKSSRCY